MPRCTRACPLHALADAGLDQQIRGALFEHARAYARLDVLAAARFDDHRRDAFQVQEVSEHQAGGTGAHNADLRARQAQVRFCSSSSAAIWNAVLAAGTPA